MTRTLLYSEHVTYCCVLMAFSSLSLPEKKKEQYQHISPPFFVLAEFTTDRYFPLSSRSEIKYPLLGIADASDINH